MRFLQEKFKPTSTPLNRMIVHAHEHNPFYRRKIDASGVAPHEIRNVADLVKLPFTSRDELYGDPWRLLSVPRESLVQAHLSTGTSGRNPIYMTYDWEDLYTRGLMPLLAESPSTKLLRIEPGEIVFNALPYEISVTGLAIHRSLQDGIGACVVPVGKGGFYSEPLKTLKLMKEIQGDHLFTTPSYAVHLAELALQSDCEPRKDFGLQSIWLIGELCSDALRRRIEALWGCPVFKYYGSMESGPIGVECAEQSGYHVASNFVAVELAKPETDLRTLSGEALSEVVITELWRYASPLIRYRTGDLAHWEKTPCRCGLASPRLMLHGRIDDLVQVQSRNFHMLEIEEGLLSIPGVSSWFQIAQEPERMRILLPRSGQLTQDKGTEHAAKTWVETRLGVQAAVQFVPVPPYGGGKFVRLVRGLSGELQ